MSRFSLPKIFLFTLGAGFELCISRFACLKPRKGFSVARFCPGAPTKFCHLGVQLFQIDQQWPGKSIDNGP
jgi:hypothetical protein